MPDDHISLSEASELAGVSPTTLQRWVKAGVIPVKGGRWTTAAAAQARVVSRMRERGHSLAELRRAVREGRLAFGYVEDLLPGPGARPHPRRGRRAHGSGGGADRADDVAAGDADRVRGDAQRSGRRRDGADRRRAGGRVPARGAASAHPGLRAVDPQDRRGGGAAVPSICPRAADPPGGRRAPDGRGDGGVGARPAPDHLAAHGVHPPALPALLHRAGRRRPHGGRARRGRSSSAGCRWRSASST